MKAIRADNLTKMFGHLVAVDHISFEVEEGEIFGFLGANGAGKTSTIMMLATALNPSSGTATVYGYDIIRERDKVRESIGIVFEELSLDTNLTAKENLDFHARLYHLPKKVRDERISQALDLVELKDKQRSFDLWCGRVERYSYWHFRLSALARFHGSYYIVFSFSNIGSLLFLKDGS